MITKLIERLIIASILTSINVIAYGEIINLKGEYYEKDGCIYLIGSPTEAEKQVNLKNYKQRIIARANQVNAEIQRSYYIELAKIKAEALRNYLIAQGMPLREVADVFKKLKIGQNVVIGNITNSSSFKEGKVAITNKNINTNNISDKTNIDVDIKK